MSVRVDRTCREVRQTASHDGRVALGEPRPLSEYRDKSAYVLLGDPGAGKTTELKTEQEALGDDAALFVSARNFRTLAETSRAEWADKTLFIDGLDETRAGAADARTPLEDIRTQLARLDKPRFRMSCREADWLGSNDHRHLQVVSPDSEITVLRLDPLDADGVRDLLRSEHQVADVEEFVHRAHLSGVGALLGNPLTLDLLARVVHGVGEWPRSRQETLVRACGLLASEHNEEHRIGRGVVSRDTVMDAAGYLCALLLLAGMEGFSLSAGNTGSGIVCLDDLGDVPDPLTRQTLEHALATKLFTADTGAERGLTPLHRQVAEFLAGRYLAKRIKAGLPAGRTVGLMTGPRDGRVVTALRGLSAWLAAHSGEARQDLIAADPVGVGLYGDIACFDPEQRQRLLESLPTSLVTSEGYWDDTAWAFRSLASASMVPALREVLSHIRERTDDDRFAALILGVLRHAESPHAVVALAPDLMAIVRDDAVPPHLRRRALHASVRVTADNAEQAGALGGLLDAVHAGSVSDPDDDLRGILLMELYPEVVGPSDVWRHIVVRSQDHYHGRLRAFANRVLLERSQERHLAELLDTLHENAAHLVPALLESRSGDLPLRVLERALDAHGETVSPKRLSGWLAVASRSVPHSDRESSAQVRAWLEQRPQIQKAVYLESLRTSSSGDDARNPFWHFWHSDVLHGSRLPPDFGLWCLDQAVALEDSEPAVSLVLLGHAHAATEVSSMSEGLTIEMMRQRTRGHTALERRLDELLQPPSPPPSDEERRREIDERRRRMDEGRRQRREERVRVLREHQADLFANRYSPPSLSSLAMTYLGLYSEHDTRASPARRVSDFVDGDPQLVDAVTAALRGAILREDVPSVDETISLHSQSTYSWMAYPVLVSLHLLDSENPGRLDGLDDARKGEALAIYYCVAERNDYAQLWDSRDRSADPFEALDWDYRPPEPHWYRRWLERDPDLVLDVLCRCALAGVRAGEPFPPGIDDLDAVEDHEALVQDARLKLLRAYPTRGSNRQLPLLDRLLTRALDYSDKTALLDLVRHKQALRSVPVAQRVRWWATAALISQGSRLQQLEGSLAESEIRVRHLAQFLRSVWDRYDRRRSILNTVTDPATLKEMIEILGGWCAPAIYPTEGFVYTLEMDTSELIQQLVTQLGSGVGDEAEQALESLIEDPQLATWRSRLTAARERQRVVQRDASYRHPSVEEVQSTLDNQEPASAADLAALLVAQLWDLSDRVRTDPKNIWSQFWNADSHGRPTDPRHENLCRDALLAALRVPAGVRLDPEAGHASGWQSDIRANCRGFFVPLEIKRDRHRDLWRAMRTQLIGQYTTDPATSGYGIYLVLWFGDGKVQTPPDGDRPRTPDELERRLRQNLTQDERRKISVIVIDVSKPHPPSRASPTSVGATV